MLNGETPVEGKYRHNVIEKLGEEDDGSDSDDSVSNAYESVRTDGRVSFGTTANHVLSPRSVILSPTLGSLSLLVLMIPIMRISVLSTCPIVERTQSPLPATQLRAPPRQQQNEFESQQVLANGKSSLKGTTESQLSLPAVLNLLDLIAMATPIRWFALHPQSPAISPTIILLRTPVSKLKTQGKRCVFQLAF